MTAASRSRARLRTTAASPACRIHPRHASQRHKGKPDYALARTLVEELPVPVLISGGLQTADSARAAFEQTGAAGVLLARGSLGNPWLFEQLLGRRAAEPDRDEILAELDWVIACAREHLGDERATRYLRKFYPWYIERLAPPPASRSAAGGASDRAEPRGGGRFAARRARHRGPRGVDPPALGEPARSPPTPCRVPARVGSF